METLAMRVITPAKPTLTNLHGLHLKDDIKVELDEKMVDRPQS